MPCSGAPERRNELRLELLQQRVPQQEGVLRGAKSGQNAAQQLQPQRAQRLHLPPEQAWPSQRQKL